MPPFWGYSALRQSGKSHPSRIGLRPLEMRYGNWLKVTSLSLSKNLLVCYKLRLRNGYKKNRTGIPWTDSTITDFVALEPTGTLLLSPRRRKSIIPEEGPVAYPANWRDWLSPARWLGTAWVKSDKLIKRLFGLPFSVSSSFVPFFVLLPFILKEKDWILVQKVTCHCIHGTCFAYGAIARSAGFISDLAGVLKCNKTRN